MSAEKRTSQFAKSETKTHTGGGGSLAFALAFLEAFRRGPRGGRGVIKNIFVEVTGNMTTTGATNFDAYAVSSLIQRFRLWDTPGTELRRDLSGAKARVQAILDLEDSYPDETAGNIVANSTTAGFTSFMLCFPIANPRSADPGETMIPVEDFCEFGGVEILAAVAAQVLCGAGLTINSASFTLHVEIVEEHDVKVYARDQITEVQTASATNPTIPIKGKLIQQQTLLIDAAAGGTAVSTITDHTIEQYRELSVPRQVAVARYLSQNRRLSATVDPIAAGKAYPLIPFYPRMTDMLSVGQDLNVRLTSTFGSPQVLQRFILPKDERIVAATKARYRVHPQRVLPVHTASKGGNKNPADWGRLAMFLPSKIPTAWLNELDRRAA